MILSRSGLWLVIMLLVIWGCPCLAAVYNVPGDFDTAQEAIDVCVDGDTVLLGNGIHTDAFIIDGKAITVKSINGPDNCRFEQLTSEVIVINVTHGTTVLDGLGFTNNQMESGSAVILCYNTNVEISNCRITENTIEIPINPFAILNARDAHLTVTGTYITNNSTERMSQSKTLEIRGNSVSKFTLCVIEGNCSARSCINVQNSDAQFDQCLISNNVADTDIWDIENSTFRLTRSMISGNRSTRYSGGIVLDSVKGAIIGGSEGFGNVFSGNKGNNHCNEIMTNYSEDQYFNARYNSFDCMKNESNIFPLRNFDLRDSTFRQSHIENDVYVSVTGSNSNDGLTPETAYLTIGHAQEMISMDNDESVTIHLGPGVYSESTNREKFPIRLHSNVSLSGTHHDTTIFAIPAFSIGIYALYAQNVSIEKITVTGATIGSGTGMDCKVESSIEVSDCKFVDTDIGLYCHSKLNAVFRNCQFRRNASYGVKVSDSNPAFFDCAFSDNHKRAVSGGDGLPSFINCVFANNSGLSGAGYSGSSGEFAYCLFKNNNASESGGALEISGSFSVSHCTFIGNRSVTGGAISCIFQTTGVIDSCVIRDNVATDAGGGIYCWASTPLLRNNLIYSNTAETGGGIGLLNSSPEIVNCTVTANTAVTGGGITLLTTLFSDPEKLVIHNSIVHGNVPDAFSYDKQGVRITYSDIDSDETGTGVIYSYPMFVDPYTFDFHLSHRETGQVADSPCVDAGYAGSDIYKGKIFGNPTSLAEFSTRTDAVTDTGTVDMGYHYPPDKIEIKPAVEITMSRDHFVPDDYCYIGATLYNSHSSLTDVPLFFIIDFMGTLLFWPSWNIDVDYMRMNVPTGKIDIDLIRGFTWPDTGSLTSDNCWTYGAMLNSEMTEILGVMDAVRWGF